MTDAELLSEAVAELYASDLEAFTERRGALAARARAAGKPSVAKKIAGLRKPTRSAWAVNQLVRADPSVPSRLAALGDELRAAETALDGAKIRELSQERRQLVDALVRQVLRILGKPTQSAAVQEELIATFGAALADPQVAEQLAAGTLLRPVQRAGGFGSGERPALALVPAPGEGRPSPAAAAAPGRPVAKSAARPALKPVARPAAKPVARSVAGPAAKPGARSAAKAVAASAAEEAERRRRRAIAEAEQALAEASQAADAASEAEREQLSVVRQMEEQLADARERLADVRRRARQAGSAKRRARQALDRLHK